MKKRLASLVMATAAVAGTGALAAPSAHAAATTYPINGSKACYQAGWYTSSNIRSVNSSNSTIKVKVADAGTGGIKIRALPVNDNVLSNTGYYPPLNTYATLTSSWGSGTQFKFQFNCVTAGKTSVW